VKNDEFLVQPTSTVLNSANRIQLAAILYDLDGTLVHTDPIHFQAWQEGLQPFGFDIDEAFYKTRISGRLNPAIVLDLLPQLTLEDRQRFIDRKEARFRELAPQLTPMAGLNSLITWANDRQIKQAVVTNAPTQNAHFMLKALKLETTFDRLIVSEELGIGKPDPAPYRHGLDGFGLRPDQAIAFEDSPSGVRSAVAAGIFTIGIASSQDPQDLYQVGAAIVISDFTVPDLWKILE
jgi:HAD superfamily hydrolase (TIGR01509 family)